MMTTSLVQIGRDGDIAVLSLSRGVTNSLNLELVTELHQAVQTVGGDPAIRGAVLRSSNEKFFSIGFDIPQLIGLSQKEFAVFYRAISRLCLDLYALPMPTAAAITGHAIAGGCVITLCCDYRFISSGRKLVGLNEVKLGVPVPHVGDCILKERVGDRNAHEIMDSGEFYDPESALRLGLVDEVLPLQEVLPTAIARIRMLASLPEGAFAEIKRSRAETIRQQVEPTLEETDRAFIDCWFSQAARERLQGAMAKFRE
jgi:enoyl-CoA hydratase/carnithine racemase